MASAENTDQRKHVGCSHFTQHFSDYTTHTSLHGFQYIGDKQRTLLERLLWSFIILTSMIICIGFIKDSFIQWLHAPIIISKAFEPSPVENIPFPAVTICPQNKIKQEAYNYSKDVGEFIQNQFEEHNHTLNDADAQRFALGVLLCDPELYEFHSLDSNPNVTFEKFLGDIEDISPNSSDDMIGDCRWRNGSYNVPQKELLVPLFTEDGICFSFNILDRDNIFSSPVIHYKNYGVVNDDIEMNIAYPVTTYSSGSGSGLILILVTNDTNLDYSCTSLPEAFKVILHDPSDIPRPGKVSSKEMTSFIVENKRDVAVRVKPEVFETSNSLKKYNPKSRGCYYPHERQLKYFKEYSEQKCEFECIRNATYRECGCVAYYMPIIDPDTPVCGLDSRPCMIKTKENLVFSKRFSNASCSCLPSCSSISYNIEVSSTKFNLIRQIQATGFNKMELFAGMEVSKINIFFKESKYFVKTRTEMYGFTSFVSDCGGLLGLFVGFSIISVVETIYFTVRAIINIKQKCCLATDGGNDDSNGSQSVHKACNDTNVTESIEKNLKYQ